MQNGDSRSGVDFLEWLTLASGKGFPGFEVGLSELLALPALLTRTIPRNQRL